MKLVRSWLSTASENQIREYGGRIANTAGGSVADGVASAVERIGNINYGAVLTDLLCCSTPEFGFGMAFPRLGEGCSVNQMGCADARSKAHETLRWSQSCRKPHILPIALASGDEQETKRRLAAIMVTDIAGYSSLMQSDEAGTFVALGTMRGAAENLVRQHRGRIANTAGDSILAEFTSAVEAVDCALALQAMLPQRGIGTELRARIGIHLGDVLERNGDLFGTAVNVAARLEGYCASPAVSLSPQRSAMPSSGNLPASFCGSRGEGSQEYRGAFPGLCAFTESWLRFDPDAPVQQRPSHYPTSRPLPSCHSTI